MIVLLMNNMFLILCYSTIGELPDKECKLLDYNFGNGIMNEYEESPPPIPIQNF